MSSPETLIETPVVEALPLNKQNVGRLSLTHLNTFVMRFGEPRDNFITYTDNAGKEEDVFIADRRFQELIDLSYPSFYLPSIDLAEWWRKDPIFLVHGPGRSMRPQKPDVSSPTMQIDGANREVDWLNSRLRFTKDLPEYTHLEVRDVDQMQGKTSWSRFPLHAEEIKWAMKNDWPAIFRPFADLPTVKWYQDLTAVEDDAA